MLRNWDGDFVELYDLDVDFEEQVNLAYQKPELTKQLDQVLQDYLEDVNAEMDLAPASIRIWEQWQEDDRSLSV